MGEHSLNLRFDKSETTNGKGLYETEGRKGSSTSLSELESNNAQEEVGNSSVLDTPPEHGKGTKPHGEGINLVVSEEEGESNN
jgi:hypothetical protein